MTDQLARRSATGDDVMVELGAALGADVPVAFGPATAVTGDAATLDAATLDAATLDAATLDAATGDAVTGDAATGDAVTGDAATGGPVLATGSAALTLPSWLRSRPPVGPDR